MGSDSSFIFSREELAWAAGFFDGEGCFCYSEAGRYICISIAQTDREVLDRFRRAVGGLGNILGPYKNRGPGTYSRKPQFVYRLNKFEHVQAVAALLWFMLGTQKRNQARRTLRKIATCRRGHRRNQDYGGCPRCTASYWQSRRESRHGAVELTGQASLPGLNEDHGTSIT
jgi:hypothetical protein